MVRQKRMRSYRFQRFSVVQEQLISSSFLPSQPTAALTLSLSLITNSRVLTTETVHYAWTQVPYSFKMTLCPFK